MCTIMKVLWWYIVKKKLYMDTILKFNEKFVGIIIFLVKLVFYRYIERARERVF